MLRRLGRCCAAGEDRIQLFNDVGKFLGVLNVDIFQPLHRKSFARIPEFFDFVACLCGRLQSLPRCLTAGKYSRLPAWH